MSKYCAIKSSSDLVINGHLPPQARQRPTTSSYRKRSCTNKKQDIGNIRRPSSAIPLWDHNTNSLSIESVSIPLSSRSKTPNNKPISCRKKSNGIITKSNSLTHIDFPSRSSGYSSPSNHQIKNELKSQSNIDIRDDTSLILDQSDDQLSSEIDVILHNINTGLILSNEEESLLLQDDFLPPPTAAIKQPTRSLNKKTNTPINDETDSIPILIQEKTPIRQQTKHWSEQQLAAAIKIQRWYRYKQEQLSKIKLQTLLHNKRDQIKAHRIKQEEQSKEQLVIEEKKQRREAKMKAARQAAIDKLKKKREEKKKETEQIIKEEMTHIEEKEKKIKSYKKQQPLKKEKIQDVNSTNNIINKEEEIRTETQQQTAKDHSITLHENERDLTETPQKEEVITQDIEEQIITTENDTKQQQQQVDEFFKAGKRKVSPSPSSHQLQQTTTSTTTMDNIYATLKELEEPSPPLPGGVDQSNDHTSTIGYLSSHNLSKLNHTTTNDSKLQSILTYLDEVENTESQSTTASLLDNNVSNTIPQQQRGGEGVLNEQLEAASALANDVTTTIATQRLEIENKNKTIEMLQKALAQQRELTVYHAKEVQKESQKRLELQKEEYEGTIGRHQCFIDQLIDDKKKLNDKCEQLLKEIKELDSKSKNKIATMEDQHAVELEKQKQAFIAAEKLRRERWRSEETQRIKEGTIKSLEPEIQRIIARGKAEIQKLKAMHEAELLQSDERVSRRFTQQIEELRIQNAQEKEMACQHERELARQKYEQLAEQEERSYQQLRKKLYSELQQERDKLTAEMNGHNNALEKQIKDLKETHCNEMTRLKAEQESVIAEIQRSHSVELRELNERTKIEKQMWEENYLKKQDAILMTKEREMREGLRKERDMEIETVIHKLERETAAAKEECERASESRIKRIREKYETELKEVERSERNTLQKFNTMKGQLSDLEGQVVKLRSHLRIKEEEVAEVNEIATRLTRERDQFADVVRQEFADRLISVEEENRQMKLEVSELIAKHKLELERLQRGKERELAEVHNRVKQALAKKEENHKKLRTQHEAALKRADHLEMLLEQQRKELLKR